MPDGSERPGRGRDELLQGNDALLLAECEVDRYRASGPGGQHRNKTESAVRVRHVPTGLTGIGEESRSQAENKATAIRRLRAQLAFRWRKPVGDVEAARPSTRLVAMIAAGAAPLGEKTRQGPEFLLAMAELLDLLVADECELRSTAARVGATTAALAKLLLRDPQVARVVNEERQRRGMRLLR